jgi:hypothetical protein
MSEQNLDNLTNTLVNQVLAQLQGSVEQQVSQRVAEIVLNKIDSLNISGMVQNYVRTMMDVGNEHYPFKDHCIPGTAVDPEHLKISGNNIDGGMVRNFASTGIEDRASSCQMTIMDAGAVFEGTLYSKRLEVKGDAQVDGNLYITGEIATDSPFYSKLVNDVSAKAVTTTVGTVLATHGDMLYRKIQQDGIDLSRVTFNLQPLIENQTLSNAVLYSQLQRVGVLKDLQTSGEALLSETLYVGNRRIGINTMEPSAALSIWDEEVELNIGKRSKDVARITTTRQQSLIIGANNQGNIVVEIDGSTTIPRLRINKILVTSSGVPPNYDAPHGSIVLNENPTLGSPIGWVSLGGARWGNFGLVD